MIFAIFGVNFIHIDVVYECIVLSCIVEIYSYSDPCFRRLRSSPVTCCEWRRSTVSGTLCCSWARSLSWPSLAPSVSSGSRSDTKFNLGLKQIVTGAIQVLRNAVGDGVGWGEGCQISWKKALRRCTVQRYWHYEGVGGGSNSQEKALRNT